MTDRIGVAVQTVTAALRYLTELPLESQITGAATLLLLLVYAEYRRKTRTTPTLRARAGTLAARGLRTAWTALRTPPTDEQKEKRGNRFESLLFLSFTAVTFGLVMQGLIPFARKEMGLTGPWPYLFFFALDGMAALFAYVAFRRAQQGGAAPAQRFMVAVITAGSSWFQWVHHASQPAAGQVAWAAMPVGVAVLFETLLTQRRRAWKRKQTSDTGRRVPLARWFWDPLGSLGIERGTTQWNLPTWEKGLEVHMTRAECIRRLRREFGPFWAWRVPADLAIRLKRGFRIEEAAALVPEVIEAHRRERENQRIIRQAEEAARTGVVEPGTYVVSLPSSAPAVDLSPLAGVEDAVEAIGEPVQVEWEDPAGAWEEPEEELDDDEVFDPAPFTPTPDTWTDPWEDATDPARITLPLVETPPTDDEPFPEFDPPATPTTGSIVERLTEPATEDPDFWGTLSNAGEDVTDDQKTIPAPADVVRYLPAPYDGPRWEEAVRVYEESTKTGTPLSTRALCKAVRVNPNNRRWANKVIAAANNQPETENPSLF